MEDELLGELLGEIKSSKKSSDVQPKLPKLSQSVKPVSAALGPINPFRSTGIRRPKRPLASNDSENVDFDVKDFDDDDDASDVKPTQTIDDFDDADFDESDLMEIEDMTTQEVEKENRFV